MVQVGSPLIEVPSLYFSIGYSLSIISFVTLSLFSLCNWRLWAFGLRFSKALLMIFKAMQQMHILNRIYSTDEIPTTSAIDKNNSLDSLESSDFPGLFILQGFWGLLSIVLLNSELQSSDISWALETINDFP
ncbi:unnamed protein product [Blepharisma stoltei]|uniref:Cytochrome c biogenesis protein n=1 Tax=Blepharisma stoltei TaxID=1481888 RepID=A0AAU9KD73_9CILI|nr:unnamed protein product [Blepharisma stoltei]